MTNSGILQAAQKPHRVLLVDDHPAIAEGLAARLASCPDLEFCEAADSAGSAIGLIESIQPDIAIIDIQLHDGDGLQLVKQLRGHASKLKILIWSMYDEKLYAERAWRAGAQGYLNKRHATDQLIEAVRAIVLGKTWFPAHLKDAPEGDGRTTDPIARLSDRELEVFRWIGSGLTTAKIADQLNVSVKTVETHRQRIKIKLKLKNSIELNRRAVHWVIENG